MLEILDIGNRADFLDRIGALDGVATNNETAALERKLALGLLDKRRLTVDPKVFQSPTYSAFTPNMPIDRTQSPILDRLGVKYLVMNMAEATYGHTEEVGATGGELALPHGDSVDVAVPDYEKAIGRSVKGMKIGIPKEYRIDGMPSEIETLWQKGAEWLKAAGAGFWPRWTPDLTKRGGRLWTPT